MARAVIRARVGQRDGALISSRQTRPRQRGGKSVLFATDSDEIVIDQVIWWLATGRWGKAVGVFDSRETTHVVMATDAIRVVSREKEHTMDLDPKMVLVREAVQLLREVRAAHCESDRILVQSLDGTIEKLEQCLKPDGMSATRIFECVKLMSQWMAALPTIERFIKAMKDL